MRRPPELAGRPEEDIVGRPPRAILLAAIAGLGLVIAAYLTWTKLTGAIPPCLPGGGCATVEASVYSAVAGVPVALFGVAYSVLTLALALAWWRRGERRALLLAYGLGLAGVLVEAFLVYLELFVIRAVCVWCVVYGVTVVAGFVVATWAVSARGPASGR
ncbi:MAG: vitamin K epoxide reductase family protein [Candidatus Limnocylindrales bacterium]